MNISHMTENKKKTNNDISFWKVAIRLKYEETIEEQQTLDKMATDKEEFHVDKFNGYTNN